MSYKSRTKPAVLAEFGPRSNSMSTTSFHKQYLNCAIVITSASSDMAEEILRNYIYTILSLKVYSYSFDVYSFVPVKTTLSIQAPSITLQLSRWCNKVNIRLTSVKHAGTLAFISKDSIISLASLSSAPCWLKLAEIVY